MSWSLGIGRHSLTTGSYSTHRLSIRTGDVATGLSKQGRESDFCYGKEAPGPGSEQLLCQTQSRLWIRDTQTWAQAASRAMPVVWDVGVSATHTAGWQEGGGKGWPGGGAHFLLAAHFLLCAEGNGTERTEGTCPDEQEPASGGEARRARWCFGHWNQESMKKAPTWTARGQTGMDFCPHSRNRVSPGVTERIAYSGLETLVEAKGQDMGRTDGRTEAHIPPSRHPLSQSSWPPQPFLPGSCYLEIKLFFTSTCLAEQDGGGRRPCLVPLCLPTTFSHKSGCEPCAQPTLVQI